MEMGLRGARDGQVGRTSVKLWPLFAVSLLAGCTSTAQIVAVVTGGVAGASTGSPAVGFLVGVATDAGANYVVRYYGRVRQGAEQDAIAQVAVAAGTQFQGLFLTADLSVRLARVVARTGDASDADAAIARAQEQYDLGELSWREVDASGTPEETLRRGQATLVL